MLETRKLIKKKSFLKIISKNPLFYPLFYSLYRNCVRLICNIDIHACICNIQFKSALFLCYQPNLKRQTLCENTINKEKENGHETCAIIYVKKKKNRPHCIMSFSGFPFFLLLHGITLISIVITP